MFSFPFLFCAIHLIFVNNIIMDGDIMWVKRSGIIYLLLLFMFVMLMFRIYYVTFGEINDKTKSVAGSRSATLELYSAKGVIYDRNICALAGNQFAYYLVVNPRGFDRSNIEYIAGLTGSDVEELNSKLQKETVFVLKSYFEPRQMEGVYIYEGTTRYSQQPTLCHLLGYLDSEGKRGLAGVEKVFNDELSVFSSKTTIKYATNALRGVIAGLGIDAKRDYEDTTNGVILTVDRNLSLAVEQSMSKHIERGCAVVMDCNNGELLALSSLPSFDADDISLYLDSENGELINNAMTNQTVGSVFKMVVAACALENGLSDFEYECCGGINVADRIFGCQNQKKHGKLMLKDAFSQSCNSYFIALGQLLGYDKIIETAQLFGADSSIEILKGMASSSGVLPEESGTLSVANLSIGQGKLMMTPLEIARITAVMCNGGYLVNPTVYYGTYIDGTIGNKSEYSYKSKIVSDDTAEKLKEMCIQCVTEGTGTNAAPNVGGAGGKTASAQTGRKGEDGNEILNTYFTGFYPADDPKYVITVFATGGESGSKTCAPVFREICDFIAQNY